MTEMIISKQYKLYLLYFLMYGKERTVSTIISQFKFELNKEYEILPVKYINIALFDYILNNWNNFKIKIFIIFFKLILVSARFFLNVYDIDKNNPEQIAVFISDVIELALKTKSIYIFSDSFSEIWGYKFNDFSFFDVKNLNELQKTKTKVKKVSDKNIKLFECYDISLEHYNKSDNEYSKSFLEIHEKLHRILCDDSTRDFCPYCYPKGKRTTPASHACQECSNIIEIIKKIFDNQDTVEQIRHIFSNSKDYKLPIEEIRKKRWKNFQRSFNKKCSNLEPLSNVNLNFKELKKQVENLVKRQLRIKN